MVHVLWGEDSEELKAVRSRLRYMDFLPCGAMMMSEPGILPRVVSGPVALPQLQSVCVHGSCYHPRPRL